MKRFVSKKISMKTANGKRESFREILENFGFIYYLLL